MNTFVVYIVLNNVYHYILAEGLKRMSSVSFKTSGLATDFKARAERPHASSRLSVSKITRSVVELGDQSMLASFIL